MDRLTRKELKTDKFAAEVTHSVQFVSEHRRQATIYGGAALALVLLVSGFWYYRKSTHQTRQAELGRALELRDAQISVTPMPGDPRPYFQSQAEKDAAINKMMQAIADKYPGSEESFVAHFHMAIRDSDAGKLPESERHLKLVMDTANDELASSAKLSLAQVYVAEGKGAEAEKLLRDLMDHPTLMVSKEQATISLARVLIPSKPAEAKKLLEPLQKDQRGAVSRNAMQVLSEIPSN